MKHSKKLLSLLLAVVLVFAFGAGVMAAQEGTLTGGEIAIDNAVSGQTYSVYQIMYLESYNADTNAYAYKANSAWSEWLKTQDDYVIIDAQGYITWVEGADIEEFAKLAQAQLESKTADASDKASGTTVEFKGLNLGYYLVDTTLGTICSLDTTNPSVVIEEKNEAPTATKEVQEDSNDDWGKINDADINQVVNFKATITVQAGAENYILHDTMSEGLTYGGVTSVTVNGNAVDEDNYTVTTPGTCKCTFEVVFDNDYIGSLEAGTQIVVEYTATLNENAVVGLDGNTNEIKLQYGDKNQPSYTPEDKTTTYTWDMDVLKYANGDKDNVLAGATFKFSTDEDGVEILKFHALGENKYEVCAKENCENEHATEITTDATGKFYIEGLDADTYYLTETAAPAGYNKLAGAIEIVVGSTENKETGALEYKTPIAEVENNSGTELPSTGGMGTTLFYVFGAVLVLGAAVILVVRRRMQAEK